MQRGAFLAALLRTLLECNSMVHPSVVKLLEKEYAPQRSERWYTMRESVITASDAGSALGMNKPFKTRDQFVREKCGYFMVDGKLVQCEKKPDTSSDATRYGCKYEDEARDEYVNRTGETVHEIGLATHPVYTWLAGSPDGITESGRLLEIKCPYKDKVDQTIKPVYLVQIQLLMEILDLDVCDFVKYRPACCSKTGALEYSIREFKRDREFFESIRPILEDTWEEIKIKRLVGLCEIGPDEVLHVSESQPASVQDVSEALLCEALASGTAQLSGTCGQGEAGEEPSGAEDSVSCC
jgi:putative phage-type endonuclease